MKYVLFSLISGLIVMVFAWFLWLTPVIRQKVEIKHQNELSVDFINKGKAIKSAKLTNSPSYHWSVMLEKYGLTVVSMRSDGEEGLSLICRGSYASLLRFMETLLQSSVDVTVLALSSAAFDLRLLPHQVQLDTTEAFPFTMPMIANPFEERVVVPQPFTLDNFLQSDWVVVGYVQHYDYLCLYLNSNDRSIFLYQGQHLFGDAWEVKVLTPQGVVMSNRGNGFTLRKRFRLPKAPKSG